MKSNRLLSSEKSHLWRPSLPRIHRSTARRPRVMADTDDSNNHWIDDSLSHVRELSNHVAELSTLMGISTFFI